MNRTELLSWIKKTYGAEPEYPWASDPDSAVFRHHDNRKWYALIMNIPRSKLGLAGDSRVDILNLKADTELSGSFLAQEGIFPAYHMNKTKWISVLLDGTVKTEQILFLLDISFTLTKARKKTAAARS